MYDFRGFHIERNNAKVDFVTAYWCDEIVYMEASGVVTSYLDSQRMHISILVQSIWRTLVVPLVSNQV